MSETTRNGGAGPEGPKPAAAPRRRRWVGWALAVSVCLNLALIGAAGGALLRHGPPGPPPGPPPGGGAVDPWTLRKVIRMLPEEERDAVRGLLRDRRPEFEALGPQRRAARQAAAAALEARPFDPAALEAALDASRAAERAGRDVIDRVFVEFATRLSDDMRATLAEEMRRNRRPPHPGRGPRHDDDDRDGPRGHGPRDGKGPDGWGRDGKDERD